MGRRRQRSHQPQTHVPPDGTPAPAPRLSPPMPGGWLPAGPGTSSSLGAHRPRGFRPEWLEGPPSTLKLPVGAIEWALFDHLVRPLQERRRDRQAECLGGLEVDDQLELRWLLDGQVTGLTKWPSSRCSRVSGHEPEKASAASGAVRRPTVMPEMNARRSITRSRDPPAAGATAG
jgi:hypothetical protein